ncbi:hypothetical protein DL93DRAFT_1113719 [Clavulina sp. PMI_390]|nr:hypothetical protein DL93DRAFT_1113719 [Clavulina sp. PMI_390]
MPPYEENDDHFVDSGIPNSSDQRKSSEEGDHQNSGSVEPHRPTLLEVRDFVAPSAGDVGAPRPTSSPPEPEGVAATLARVNLSTTSSGVRSETGAHLSLAALCNLIESTPTLAEADILSVECYTQWSHVVIHRFVVLRLHRQGKRDMYLRMDRRVDQQVKNNQVLETLKFLFASGKTAANDEARTCCSLNIQPNFRLAHFPQPFRLSYPR